MLKVSILIPCYNAERWVAQSIQSALDQSYGLKEVIVVDDGSTDGSLQIIQSFGDRIRYYASPNRGGNSARNQLLQLAAGEFVQFLDADDYLRPTKIADQLQSMVASGTDADVIYSPVVTEVWSGGMIAEQSIGVIESSSTLEEQWIRWQVAQTGAVQWRREALRSIGGWNEAYPCCQDNEVTLRAIQHGLKFHFCPEAGAVYRIWSQETVCRKDPSRVIHVKTHLIEQMLEWLKSGGRLGTAHLLTAKQMCFEMGRLLAAADMDAATIYSRQRKRAGLWKPVGPAAPWHYRLAHKMLGFRVAEILAQFQRSGGRKRAGRIDE